MQLETAYFAPGAATFDHPRVPKIEGQRPQLYISPRPTRLQFSLASHILALNNFCNLLYRHSFFFLQGIASNFCLGAQNL